MSVEVGQQAPDFELRDQHNQPVRLSDYRGKRKVVLVFYPFSFSRVCEGELCSLRDEFADFEDADAQILAVSIDSPFVQRQWAKAKDYSFPVLADFWPHGETARAYGVFNEATGAADRGTFIIDREGVVRWKTVNAIPDARDQDEYKKVLAELG